MQAGDTIFRTEISDVLRENNMGAGQFVAEEIMPIMNVGKQNGSFAKIAFSSIRTKAVDDRRAPGSKYNRIRQAVTKDTYDTVERGLELPIDKNDNLILQVYFDTEVEAATAIEYYLRLNREARMAAIAFSTSVMTGRTAAVTTAWDAANSTPVKDVENAKEQITRNLNGTSGPGSRIIGVGNLSLRKELANNTDIKNRHYSGGNVNRQSPTDAQLAEILGLDAVYFSGASRGGSDIWGATKFGIYQVSSSNMLKVVPSFGRIMLWNESTPVDMMVETYWQNDINSNVVRVSHNSVEKTLTTRAGYLLTGVTT